MRYLFLAEKPSTMKSIKEAYEHSNKPIGDIDFFALSGHVCKLCDPKEYEKWNVKWNERELPMIPANFKVGILTSKVEDLRKQLQKVKYDAIIVGTDSDVEGNGIYDLVETYLGLQNYKAYRFFETDLTPASIMKSMQSLTDYHSNPRDVRMTESYRIRSRFDWLIGFNMSVAYTVRSGFLMKVGRVKAPTLKLVYDNCKAIDSFTVTTRYQPTIKFLHDDQEIEAFMIDDESKILAFPTKEEAEAVNLSGTAEVVSFEKTIKKTQPSQLYKLTDIQYEAGMKHGYTPEKTLEIIQSLYEKHKLVSYPRTDGRYVSSEKAKDFRKLLRAVAGIPELTSLAKSVTPATIMAVQKNKRYVNDAEVAKTSHDALLPTGLVPDLSKLSEAEKNICTMIYKRFLAIFLLPLEEEKSRAILVDNGQKFMCGGSKVINPGFSVLFRKINSNPLPELTKGERYKETERGVHEVVSKPPTRFTQASLIKAMENVQKYMSAGTLKDAMKKAGGIGQPSSRASIISELISSKYIEDVKSGKGKGLHITELGKKYIENLQNTSIINPELSAQWEVYMSDMREGARSYDEVYAKILEYVDTALHEIKTMPIKKAERKVVGKCPVCGKPVVVLSKGYGCSGYPECHFSIFKTVAGKTLTEKNIKDLLEGRPTDVISGFISKKGKPFSSTLIIKDGKVTWGPFSTQTNYKCPICGKPIVKTPMSYKCSDDRCGFILWNQFCEKDLTETQISQLLLGKQTAVIKGLKRKDGTKFDAALVIKDGKLDFAPKRLKKPR